jgi:hypothetical protein
MKFLSGLLMSFLILHSARADDSSSTNLFRDWPENFDKGAREISAGAGVLFSPFGATGKRPTENYAGPLVQVGCMLNSPDSDAAWRGNFEALGELFGAGIFEGSGNYIASTTLWLRYNIVPPKWNIAPYLQAGAGVSLTDVDHRVFGQAFNFNLDAAAGLRYILNQQCSLNVEYRFQHVSNAGMAKHNLGINAQGTVLSVSWYF